MTKRHDFTIRGDGDTRAPALAVIKDKGYEIEYIIETDTGYKRDCTYCYNATKDGWLISATTAEELLGLIVMWETRGINWKATAEEAERYRGIWGSGPVYGPDGSVIEDA